MSDKARIVITITKDVDKNGRTIDQIIEYAENNFYDFIHDGSNFKDTTGEFTGRTL